MIRFKPIKKQKTIETPSLLLFLRPIPHSHLEDQNKCRMRTDMTPTVYENRKLFGSGSCVMFPHDQALCLIFLDHGSELIDDMTDG